MNPFDSKKYLRILIPNYDSSLNYGCAALLISLIKILKSSLPNPEITVLTTHPEVPVPIDNIRVVPTEGTFYFSKKNIIPRETCITLCDLFLCIIWRIFFEIFHIDLKALRNTGTLKEYSNSDVVISAGGDTLTEDNGLFSFISNVNRFLFAWLLKKPFILQSETIGPFTHWWSKLYAKFILNRAKLIIVREELSYKYLKNELHIKSSLAQTADLAFLFDAAPAELAIKILREEGLGDGKKPLVGINCSKKVSSLLPYSQYIEMFSELIDYITTSLNAVVIIVPHVIEKGNDDRIVAEDVYKPIKNKKDVLLIKGEYAPQEIKAVIAKCDLFVGARMHSVIASTSMNVPTICIAYSNKAHGIIGNMLGYKKYVIDINEMDYDTLIYTINDVWNNRWIIKKELKKKITEIKKLALLNEKIIKRWIIGNL